MGRLFLSSSSSDDGGSSTSRGFWIGDLGTGGSCTGLEEKEEEEEEEAAASRRRSCCERDVFGGLRGRRAGWCGGERGWVCGWEKEEEQALRVSLRRLRDMDGGGWCSGRPASPCRGRTPKRRRQFWFGRRVFWLIQQRTNGQNLIKKGRLSDE